MNQLSKGIYMKYGDTTPTYALSSFLVHYLSNGMPNDDSCPFDLLLRQPRSNAHLQRRLELPIDVLSGRMDSSRHALESGNEDPIRQALCTKSAGIHGRLP